MATTTNYGWTTPDDTSLVKDGAAAIRTLGSSVDTTTKALNPSTTLGDIEYRSSTANTNTRLAIGTTGQVLTVAAGVPSWATPAGAGMELITSATFTTVATVSLPTNTFSSTYRNYQIILDFTGHSVDSDLLIRARVAGTDDTSNNYFYGVSKQSYLGAYTAVQAGSTNAWRVGQSEFYERAGYTFTYLNPKGTTGKLNVTGQSAQISGISGGLWHSTVTNVDSMTFSKASGTFNGIYRVYGLRD